MFRTFSLTVCLPLSFDPHNFAYRANWSTEDTIAITLNSALSHLEYKKSYARMLFMDYSSAFNTIISNILHNKLGQLQIPLPIRSWIKNFLSSRIQFVRLGPYHHSSTLSTRSIQGCVLSPVLYALYTSDCSLTYPTNCIIKYVDNTTVVEKQSLWCSANLTLKTEDTHCGLLEEQAGPPPLLINREHFQVSGHPHLLRPLLDFQFQGPDEEVSAVATLPACPQDGQPGHAGKRPDLLSGRVLRRLHG